MKTIDKQKLVLELSMCVQAVDTLRKMWDIVTDEDKQGMARHLFQYITYDLGTRQIVDFRLKPWADQFLILRAGLYANQLFQVDGNQVVPTGIDAVFVPSVLRFPDRSLSFAYKSYRTIKYLLAQSFN